MCKRFPCNTSLPLATVLYTVWCLYILCRSAGRKGRTYTNVLMIVKIQIDTRLPHKRLYVSCAGIDRQPQIHFSFL